MPGEMSRGRLVQRLITFYAILAVIGVAVVIFVVDQGGGEKALPTIAGGYVASAPSKCLGPAPKPVGGAPLPATAPAQAAPARARVQHQPVRAVRQLRQQPADAGRSAAPAVRVRSRVAVTASPERSTACHGSHQKLDVIATAGVKGAVAGTLGGAPFAATLKSAPPAPGAALPRTPSGIGGKYAASPSSTCFGGSFTLQGGGSSYALATTAAKLGRVTYSTKTGAVAGDVGARRAGTRASPRRRTTCSCRTCG